MFPSEVELVNKTHQLAPEAMGGKKEKILILVHYLSFTVTN